MLTNVFFFDGASNVWKAGRVLTVKYPRAIYLQGGEDVLSLSFTDLAKIIVVKV